MPSGNLFHTNGMSGGREMKSDEVHSAQYWLIRKIVDNIIVLLYLPVLFFSILCLGIIRDWVGYVYFIGLSVIAILDTSKTNLKGQYPTSTLLKWILLTIIYLLYEWSEVRVIFLEIWKYYVG